MDQSGWRRESRLASQISRRRRENLLPQMCLPAFWPVLLSLGVRSSPEVLLRDPEPEKSTVALLANGSIWMETRIAIGVSDKPSSSRKSVAANVPTGILASSALTRRSE